MFLDASKLLIKSIIDFCLQKYQAIYCLWDCLNYFILVSNSICVYKWDSTQHISVLPLINEGTRQGSVLSPRLVPSVNVKYFKGLKLNENLCDEDDTLNELRTLYI